MQQSLARISSLDSSTVGTGWAGMGTSPIPHLLHHVGKARMDHLLSPGTSIHQPYYRLRLPTDNTPRSSVPLALFVTSSSEIQTLHEGCGNMGLPILGSMGQTLPLHTSELSLTCRILRGRELACSPPGNTSRLMRCDVRTKKEFPKGHSTREGIP